MFLLNIFYILGGCWATQIFLLTCRLVDNLFSRIRQIRQSPASSTLTSLLYWSSNEDNKIHPTVRHCSYWDGWINKKPGGMLVATGDSEEEIIVSVQTKQQKRLQTPKRSMWNQFNNINGNGLQRKLCQVKRQYHSLTTTMLLHLRVKPTAENGPSSVQLEHPQQHGSPQKVCSYHLKVVQYSSDNSLWRSNCIGARNARHQLWPLTFDLGWSEVILQWTSIYRSDSGWHLWTKSLNQE